MSPETDRQESWKPVRARSGSLPSSCVHAPAGEVFGRTNAGMAKSIATDLPPDLPPREIRRMKPLQGAWNVESGSVRQVKIEHKFAPADESIRPARPANTPPKGGPGLPVVARSSRPDLPRRLFALPLPPGFCDRDGVHLCYLVEIKRFGQKKPNICNFFKIQLIPAAYKGRERTAPSPSGLEDESLGKATRESRKGGCLWECGRLGFPQI